MILENRNEMDVSAVRQLLCQESDRFNNQSYQDFVSFYAKYFESYDIIFLYGSGQDGKKILDIFWDIFRNKEIFFIDSNNQKHKKIISHGVCCYGIEKTYEYSLGNAVLVIASREYAEEIFSNLNRNHKEKLGVIPICYEFIKEYRTHEDSCFELIQKHEEDIANVWKIVEDDLSRYTLYRILANRLNGKTCMVDVFHPGQYYDEEIVQRLGNDEVYLDCGAYIGDTIAIFRAETKDSFQKIYAFELDENNYEVLQNNPITKDKRIKLFHSAVGEKDGEVGYVSGITSSSVVEKDSSAPRKKAIIRSVDAMIEEGIIKENITFVKMDIEGAELSALKGMKNMILRCKPKLAICIYHKTEDLWEIPLWLKHTMPKYHFSIRHHRDDMCETVLYAFV